MESKISFLFNLVDNFINIFNKLFNLLFTTALLFVLSNKLDNGKLYWLTIIVYSLLSWYVVWLSHKLYIKKGDKIISLNMLGFILCILFSAAFLYLTYSATFLINMISV